MNRGAHKTPHQHCLAKESTFDGKSLCDATDENSHPTRILSIIELLLGSQRTVSTQTSRDLSSPDLAAPRHETCEKPRPEQIYRRIFVGYDDETPLKIIIN